MFEKIKEFFRHRFGKRAKAESKNNKPSPKIKKLPNGNIEINGREYLSPAASKAHEDAMNKEDPRFEDSESWN